MPRKRRALKLGVVALAALILGLVTAGYAFADYAPLPGDVVGVGGDTPQFAVDFALNGDISGDVGFNASTGTVNRAIYFDAVPDANGRQAYTNNVTTGANSALLNATDVLRAGKSPVQRNQSSGNAISALLADTATPHQINYVGSASLPSSTQQSTAASNGWGYLHVVEIGTDNVEIAASSTTNAPASLSAADLLNIYDGTYTTWNQVPGYGGPAPTAAIHPKIPQSSSTIYKTLIADLTTANGGTAPTLASDVQTVEQNDPSTVSGDANAIVPFSQARDNLWNSNYFLNPATPFPGGSPISAGIQLLGGYSSQITDYIIFRQSDLSSTTPVEPGASTNWAQALFSGTNPFFKKSTGQALLAASGITPVYNDLGNVHS
jgi:hypothetical protein